MKKIGDLTNIGIYSKNPYMFSSAEEYSSNEEEGLEVGTYVIATSDYEADPNSPWGVGFVGSVTDDGNGTVMYTLEDDDGNQIGDGEFILSREVDLEVGIWFIENMETIQDLQVNLWFWLDDGTFPSDPESYLETFRGENVIYNKTDWKKIVNSEGFKDHYVQHQHNVADALSYSQLTTAQTVPDFCLGHLSPEAARKALQMFNSKVHEYPNKMGLRSWEDILNFCVQEYS